MFRRLGLIWIVVVWLAPGTSPGQRPITELLPPLTAPEPIRLPKVSQPPDALPPPEEIVRPTPIPGATSGEDQPADEDGQPSGDAGGEAAEAMIVPPRLWTGSIEYGLNGTHGNTDTFNLRLGASAARKTPSSIMTLEVSLNQKSANTVRTAQNVLFDGRLEWPFPDTPLSYFAHNNTEVDQFKAFDVRAGADTGIGYYVLDDDVSTLVGRVGGSVSREFGGPDDRYVPEMTFGVEWKHHFSPRQIVSANVNYFPDVTDFGDFRCNSKMSWEVVVDPDWGLSLKLSVIDRFDSTPNGVRQNDVDYAVLMLWSY